MATLAARITALAGAIRDKLNLMTPRLVPAGGTTGQVLAKASATDYALSWTAIGTSNVADGAITLAKQANVATGTICYRKSAGAGVPEMQTLATLKTDLGLTGTNSGDQTITLTGDATGSGTGSFAVTLAASGVGAGTYRSVTVDTKGRVTGGTNPTTLAGYGITDAATQAYVDALFEGMAWKDSVRAASTANINLASPGTTIDAVAMAAGDRFLAKDQTTGNQNGIYVWNGSAVAATRAADASTFAEMEAAVVTVEEGTAGAGTVWRQTAVNGTLGTTTITWAAFGGSSGFQVDVFTSSGTWTKPSWANQVDVMAVGGGGGGSGGGKWPTGSNRSGGGGGGGGGYSRNTFRASDLTGTVNVTVGAGGNGGGAQATNSTAGVWGGTGGQSSFGSYLRAGGGDSGYPGVSGFNTTASSGGGDAMISGATGGRSNNASTTSSPGIANAGGGGGGCGGGFYASGASIQNPWGNTPISILAGGSPNAGSGFGSTTHGNAGPAGASTAAGVFAGGGGGGGGTGSSTGGTPGGTGGAGGLYGGGGGGGGAGTDSVCDGGAGGAGGAGVVVVISRA